MFHQIMKSIIADLMKAPLEKKSEGISAPHEAKIEIHASGKPEDAMNEIDPDQDGDIDTGVMESPEEKHLRQMKKLHSMR